MFLKDEYIVCLNTPIDNGFFPPNFVYKQKEEKEWLSVYHDIKGGDNGWVLVRFNRSEKYSEWRYATEEEAEEYERLGKPYDVSTVNNFILPEKWWIKVTTVEQDRILTEYCNTKFNNHQNAVHDEPSQPIYYYNELINNSSWHVGSNKADGSFTEITYSQFLKYVLGKDVIEVKEDLTQLKDLLLKIGV
jgi:hypothetical protein